MPPQRGKSAAQIAAEDDARPTRNETPYAVDEQTWRQDSRLNMLRDAPPRLRAQLVWLTYVGRKGSRGSVRRTMDEHIDVIVPDDGNAELVDAYLDQVAPGGVLSPQLREDLAKAGISGDTLHISGEGYHFQAQESTPVLPEHKDWLLTHPGYAFVVGEEPDPRDRDTRDKRWNQRTQRR